MKVGLGRKEIPQLIGFARVSSAGKIRLKKNVLEALGFPGRKCLFIDDSEEFLLSALDYGRKVTLESGNAIRLPADLCSNTASLVCFIQRRDALAVKKIETVVEEGEEAEIVDKETATAVSRVVKIFPEPEKIYARLEKENRGILLAVPWLARNQNPDGSWGRADYAESATLGVVKALCSVGYFHD